ncbi:RDD family protein [Caballeronia sp. LZ035]|uniref:RDD family protein n=1 Tax=Caballeronia sp. LZ035 TaxID=3038568 RepID=UPI002861B821|nr:RDD family protein [Caballeronia sp. LZ035]MDR5755378.1 RDD family protein [Caballeronia sp. LZ035]
MTLSQDAPLPDHPDSFPIRLATVSERGRALFIDSLWWTLIALFVPLGPSLDTMPLSPDALAADMILWLMLAQCVPILITGVLWAVWGTTPGKHVLKLRIVDADSGEPMTLHQSMLRTFGYLLTFAMFGAGFLWIWFNPRKQALHDRIANTVVVTGRTRIDNPIH